MGLLLVALLPACTKVGPDFVKPDAPVAEDWIDNGGQGVRRDTAEHSDWWTVFDDPVLDALIDRAYRQNLSLQIAGIRILEARAQLGIAAGNQYPQVQRAGGGLTQIEISDNQANAFAGLDTSYADADLGLEAGWELDVWGRFRRGIEAADANLLAEVANYDDALVSLTAEVANAYVLIRTFEERLALARDNVAIQARSRDIARVRFDNGISTELDVQQARTLLANTQALIPQLEIGLRQAQNGLSILMGMPPGDLRDMLGGTGKIPVAPADVALGMPADLLRRRPDIRAAELQAAAQSARIGLTKADLYPSFSLTGAVGLRASSAGAGDLGDLFDGGSLEAGFGPSFSWNILNYGRIRNAVRVEDARFQQAAVNYQNSVLNAAREVEDAVIAFVRGQQQVRFLGEGVDAADRSVELALVQYRDGAADYTRVLNTQEFLVAQQDAYTTARGDVVRSLIATYRALGGGWQIRAGNDFVPEPVEAEMRERTNWGRLLEPEAVNAPEQPETFRAPDW